MCSYRGNEIFLEFTTVIVCFVCDFLVPMAKKYKLVNAVAILILLTLVFAEEEESKSKKDSVGTVIGIDLGTTYSWYSATLNSIIKG
jgi:hypothetical protein